MKLRNLWRGGGGARYKRGTGGTGNTRVIKATGGIEYWYGVPPLHYDYFLAHVYTQKSFLIMLSVM